MSVLCPYFTLTWYPTVYPEETGARVLIGADSMISDVSPIAGGVSQLIEEAEYIRGAVPEMFLRGQERGQLQWEEVREVTDPGEQLALGLEGDTNLPKGKGWVKLELSTINRVFVYSPVAVESTAWRPSPVEGKLYRTWVLRSGPPSELGIDAEDYSILNEAGFPIGFEDGAYLVGEDAA
jgi:hypothetical protein